MQLSKHFTLAELTVTNQKVNNIPSAEQIAKLKSLCNSILEPVRIYFGKPVIITSGFRSFAVNKAVGGSITSQHSKGEAADFTVKGVANAEVWKYIRYNLVFDQLIAEKLSKADGHKGWIHVSYSAVNNREQALSYVGGKYVPELVYEG